MRSTIRRLLADGIRKLKAKFDNSQALNSKNDLVKNAAHYYKQRDFQQIWVDGDDFTSAVEVI